jgi:hypothetical protein
MDPCLVDEIQKLLSGLREDIRTSLSKLREIQQLPPLPMALVHALPPPCSLRDTPVELNIVPQQSLCRDPARCVGSSANLVDGFPYPDLLLPLKMITSFSIGLTVNTLLMLEMAVG